VTKTCKIHTAQRRRRTGKYKDPQSSWTKTTKGREYGRKAHMSLDAQNLLQEYFNPEYIWYVRNRNYDETLGLAILAYNLCVMSNVLNNRPHRKVADIVGCY